MAQTGLGRPAGPATIGLIGHGKDHTSYYLKLFPQWGVPIDVPEYLQRPVLHPHPQQLFLQPRGQLSQGRRRPQAGRPAAGPSAAHAGARLPGAPSRRRRRSATSGEEYEFVLQYRAQWAVPKVPYPVTFVTVDACVVTAGSVLLVRRKGRPGKGLWALPGGFLDQAETVVDGMLRELREETKIAVPPGMLRGSIVTQRVFDDPNRSSRGRTITHGFLIHLKNETALPGLRSRKPARPSCRGSRPPTMPRRRSGGHWPTSSAR